MKFGVSGFRVQEIQLFLSGATATAAVALQPCVEPFGAELPLVRRAGVSAGDSNRYHSLWFLDFTVGLHFAVSLTVRF